MRNRWIQHCGLVAALTVAAAAASAQTAITTYHYDNNVSGLNTNETVLTPQNVNSASFGKLFSLATDGKSHAQPLYLPQVSIPGKGVHNVVYVATEHDSVYAFDADSNSGANAQPLWKVTLLDAAHGAAPGAIPEPISDLGSCGDIPPEVGIVGTPVIDRASGTIYLVGKTNEKGVPVQRLHALDVTTGAERPNSPVVIQATVNGIGSGSSGGKLSFDPKWNLQRTGLVLANGTIYVGFGSHCDFNSWHGWLIAYDGTTLRQTSALATTPNSTGAGIWMSGAAPAAEVVNGVTRIYVTTGNGTFDSNGDYADDILRIESTNGVMRVADHFTPYNQATLASTDADISAGGVVLLPDQNAGGHQRLLVSAAKLGEIYLVDRDRMGFYSTLGNNIVQDLPQQLTGLWGLPAFFNNTIYFWGSTYESGTQPEVLKAYSFTNGRLSTTPVQQGTRSTLFPSVNITVSSNGASSGIVWGVITQTFASGGNPVLVAHDASNVSRMLYASDQNPGRDGVAGAVKFTVPVVTNGKVYFTSESALNVFGPLTTQPTPGGGVACHVSYVDQSDWGLGFVGNISITNSGSRALNGWTLSWTWSGNQQLLSAWNANGSQRGNAVTLTSAPWNTAIAAGATLTGIGFIASESGGNIAPTAFVVNGTTCR